MSEVIGYKKIFYLNTVVKESDFPNEFMNIKINGIKVKFAGRNVYGFFVTNKEFHEKVAKKYCFDGWYDVPLIKYEEPIILGGISGSSTLPSREYLRKIENGDFIKTSKVNVKNTLKELGVEVREIKWYHKLGWPFKA